MQIMKASQQWSTRPADERFWTVQELYDATKAHRESAATATVKLSDMRAEAKDGEVILVGSTGSQAELTHFAFGQLSARAEAPASYLRSLPATLAVQNLNHGLKRRAADDPNAEAKLLLHKNGGYFARAITSDKYTRIWNYSIVERLLGLEAQGWRVPPAYATMGFGGEQLPNTRRATKEQASLSLTIREGDLIGPAGLYASFEDMFAFMVHPERVVKDGSEGGLMRGFLVWNSEVGKATFGIQTFYFRGVCGNHIIWDASNVKEISLRHVGNADERAFSGLEVELKKYADESVSDIEAKIQYAKTFVLKSKTKEDVIDFIFRQKILTRQDAVKAYEAVVPEVDGDAYTAYGYAQGITRLSQKQQNADVRVALDRAAGKVLEVAF